VGDEHPATIDQFPATATAAPSAVSPSAPTTDVPLTAESAELIGASPMLPDVATSPGNDESAAEQTAWDKPIVTATRSADPAPPPVAASHVAADATEVSREPGLAPVGSAAGRPKLTLAVALLALVATVVAGTRVADSEGWVDVSDVVSRTGALVATWAALVLLVRRCGGRTIIIGVFAAVALGLAGAYPEPWALAGAAVAAAAGYGLLGMVLTRPAHGLGLLRELVVSAFLGVMGAFVVSGYDVELRAYRFRILILAVVLLGGLALAWRLGDGARSIGRRGAVLIVFVVVLLVGALAYAQAVRAWGSSDVTRNVTDFRDAVSDLIGASPRPLEALVGFPALVWGVAVRTRRRQGWWMCAFGALGAGGVVSALVDPDVVVHEAMLSTAYDVVVGGAIGLLVVLVDRLVSHGGGRRADSTTDVDPDRPEPSRFEPLL
jgi:hypothetical protein